MTSPQPESELQKLSADFKAFVHWAELKLHLIHASVDPTITQISTVTEPPVATTGVGEVTTASISQIDAVAQVAITPAEAVAKSQTEIQNLGYVSYLNNMSQADRDAWMADYLTLASANGAAPDVAVGAQVYNPVTKLAVEITDAAQANLILLHNLGANIVTGGTPNQ